MRVDLWLQPEPFGWSETVEDALDEDIGPGDLTAGCIDPDDTSTWYIEAESDCIVCGLGIVDYLLGQDMGSDGTYVEAQIRDGDRVRRGDRLIEGVQLTRTLLSCERVALNFLMMLSGVATLTSNYVRRVEGTGAKIVDTRKTVPILRHLQKYAVRCGGGGNHRMGLYDAAMLKDNHIAAVGSITKAVKQYRTYAPHLSRLEVECESMEQVEEALACGVDAILLDNMDPFLMREVVSKHKGRATFEASGGITLDTVLGVAQTGVQLISVGALTHSAVSVPFNLEFNP